MINTRKEREREREREKERQKNIMFNTTTKRDATKRLLKMYSIFALENSKKNRKFSL